MAQAGRGGIEREILRVGRRGEERSDQAEHRDDNQNDAADDGQPVLAQARPGVLPERMPDFDLHRGDGPGGEWGFSESDGHGCYSNLRRGFSQTMITSTTRLKMLMSAAKRMTVPITRV